jgi:antimicrobial peptide system SdpB family protein
MAFSMILTLIFSDVNDLFVEESFSTEIVNSTIFNQISYFIIWGKDGLIYAKMFAILILLIVISGFLPKIGSVFHWWISLSFIQTAAMVEGGDQVTAISTFLFMGITLLDPRSNSWSSVKKNKIISQYKLKIAQILILLFWIQVSYLYFQASSSKLNISEWKDGSVIYYWITNNTFGTPFFPTSLLKFNFITLFLSWSGIIIEVLLAYSILASWEIKRIFFYVGVIFHLGIYFMLGLASFSLVMIGVLFLYLLPPIETNYFHIITKWYLGKINK